MDDYRERRIGDLTIRIDRSRCIATSNCMKVAPRVFHFDDENICAFQTDPSHEERERLIEACRVCPVGVLSIFDDDGKQLLP